MSLDHTGHSCVMVMGDSMDSIHGMLRLNHSQSPRDIQAVSIKESIIHMYTYACIILYTRVNGLMLCIAYPRDYCQ